MSDANEVEAMPAGRPLDALVAEHVFGYHREGVPPDASGEHGGNEVLMPPGVTFAQAEPLLPKKGEIPLWSMCFSWSTNPVPAWTLATMMRRIGYRVSIELCADGEVEVMLDAGRAFVVNKAPTFPLAMSRAAILAHAPDVIDAFNAAEVERRQPYPVGRQRP
jgi:hypothetical protein